MSGYSSVCDGKETNTPQFAQKITRNELENTTKSGIHKLLYPFVGYKSIKCDYFKGWFWQNYNADNFIANQTCIAKVVVPEKAQIVRGTDSATKLRASKFDVIDIYPVDKSLTGGKPINCQSFHDDNFKYFDGYEHSATLDLLDKTCSTGLHFFKDEEEARDYHKV